MARAPLAGINLNLFPVLDALLRHRSATRAAAELGVTPSAVSHALRELRAQFDDPLFVRRGGGLAPTERALHAAPSLRDALALLDGTLHDEPHFDPATCRRHFVVSTIDDGSPVYHGALVARMLREAPHATVDLRMRSRGAHELLAESDVDLVLQLSDTLPSWMACETMFHEEMVCLVRDGHPATELDSAAYTSFAHVRVSVEGYGKTLVDSALEARGLERHVAVYVGALALILDVVVSSDLIATVPAHWGRAMAPRYGLRVHPVPLAMGRYALDMVWNATRDDAALRWFRGILLDVTREAYRS